MDPANVITEVGSGVAGGGAVLYVLFRLVKLGEGALETWRAKRNGNGHADGEHGDKQERRGDRAQLRLLSSIDKRLGELNANLTAANATLLERTARMERDIEALRNQT